MSTSYFEGADLVVLPLGAVVDERYHGRTVVVTGHAKELTELIYQLKEEYKDRIDYYNKYAFYPELGKAANAYLKTADDLNDLLAAVRKAAAEFKWS